MNWPGQGLASATRAYSCSNRWAAIRRPAVAMAALHVAEKHGRDALLLVLAADHLIKDQPAFARAVADAASLAAQDYLVTFGIVPDAPETGFGYIESGEALGAGKVVKRFVEKPSLEKAQEYLAAGNFLWNSGMFCFKAGAVLDELARHAPDVLKAVGSLLGRDVGKWHPP